jgi:hypothetical protein
VVVELLMLEHRVDWHHYGTTLPGSVLGDEELRVVLGVDGDPIALLHAVVGQQRREAVGEVVELPVGDLLVKIPDGVAVGDVSRRFLEEIRHALLR